MSKYWIFDFDGTLVDSEKPIKECYKKITAALAPSRIKIAEEILIGPTLQETTKIILGSDNANQYENFIELFKKEYDENLLLDTKPYLGVFETLQTLIKRGDKLAIATNKRQEATHKLINHYGWNEYFNWIGCANVEEEVIKNKNELVKFYIKNNPKFSNAYFVGDTENDGDAATHNKLKFIKVNYGYGQKQKWINSNIHSSINNFNELTSVN
jgi:phosphoglycolate phosphatase